MKIRKSEGLRGKWLLSFLKRLSNTSMVQFDASPRLTPLFRTVRRSRSSSSPKFPMLYVSRASCTHTESRSGLDRIHGAVSSVQPNLQRNLRKQKSHGGN